MQKKITISVFLTVLLLFLISSTLLLAADNSPVLSLKDSLPIAEEALTQNQIDAAKYFIFSVVYTRSNKGYYWYYTWRPKGDSSAGGEIHLKVYMDKTVEVK